MSNLLSEDLPEVLQSVRTRPLFLMRLEVPPLLVVGATPNAFRRIGVITGGSFEGERLSGEVLNGGNDWQSVRNDGCTKLNVRLMLRTTNSSLIVMTYEAVRHGPPNVMERLDKGENVDPRAIIFVSIRCSRQAPENMTGLIASSLSAPASGAPTDRCEVVIQSIAVLWRQLRFGVKTCPQL